MYFVRYKKKEFKEKKKGIDAAVVYWLEKLKDLFLREYK
jgi:hypothetical protein